MKKRMRINFLLPHFGKKPSGGFKIAYIYANYLSTKGYQVTITHAYSMNKRNMKDFFNYFIEKIKADTNNPGWFHFNEKIKRKYVFKLNSRTIDEADYIVATAWSTAKVLNDITSNKAKKLYLIQHYEACMDPKKEVDETWKYNMKKIVISKWLCKIGTSLGAKDLLYIPNGLDFNKYRLITEIENRDLVISMLYSEIPWKRSKLGIEVLKILKRKYTNLKVLLFGINERPVNIPKWMTYYKNPDQKVLVNDIYNQSAVFLCTSRTEGWGLPPMEAMACGCAVVTTANGGVEDFAIHGETALLCKADQVAEMVDAVSTLIEDRALCYRIAHKGNQYVKKFTWDSSFQKFEQILKER